MNNRFEIKTGVLSNEEVISSMELAYQSEAHWGVYFDHFNDLFTNKFIAEEKSKSQSVGYLCIQLYKNNGCSIDRLYSILMGLIRQSTIEFNSDVLDLSTKDSFFFCLEKLNKQLNS